MEGEVKADTYLLMVENAITRSSIFLFSGSENRTNSDLHTVETV